ncbi:hypothetical protein Btru_078083 [Bulinus truncatus]|nr:hypothetical protein Btru_078083 [Bulinus truncatus]
MYSKEIGYDFFEDEDDDSFSETNGTSSDDEIDIILHGTPQQRKKLKKLHSKRQGNLKQIRGKNVASKSSSEDEFEKEMNAELNKHVKILEDSREKESMKASSTSSIVKYEQPLSQTNPSENTSSSHPEYYDGVYFDSDEENAEDKHAIISNDDLLYDPDMDDEDQKWVDRQRNRGQPRGPDGKRKKAQNSDALLDCPACMTTLCLDCQRHEIYKHQYRAMFVMNCMVDMSETLECPEQATKKRKKKGFPKTDTQNSSASTSTDMFHPVKCTECNTVVGVIDKDEVYHFFNVLASYT